MANQRPNLSITLPTSFYLPHDSAPRTPERPIRTESPLGAQTTQARFRLRRRPGGRSLSSNLFAPPSPVQIASEMPIPSIEVGSEDYGAYEESSPVKCHMEGFLSPLSSHYGHDLPTTPAAQTASFDGNSWATARQREIGESILRPMSQCSMWSNSSDESDSLSTVASSYGTGCTSPERMAGDPFYTPSKDDGYNFTQPLLEAGRIPDLGSLKPKAKINWTTSMDDHLWTAYQLYLQDPTATPIKTLPGNAPPLGVCHRVARQAKHTWREPKIRRAALRLSTPQPVGSPKLNLSQELPASDIEEPERRAKTAATWPKLGATRRRLRHLAKSRATIAPHYMRLIAGRTPSPFSSSGVRTASSRQNSNAPVTGHSRQQPNTSRKPDSMDSRDVRLALVTATSETMQPDGPLARLQRDTPQPLPDSMSVPAPRSRPFSFNDPAVPFASPAALPSSAICSSGIDLPMPDAPMELPPRLGSPFVPSHARTWAAPGRRQPTRGSLASSTFKAPYEPDDSPTLHVPRPSTATGPRSLRSPIHFTSSFPYNKAMGSKRRAEHSLEDTSSPRHISHRRPGLDVDELFGPPLQAASISRDGARSPVEQRRVRLRGFSLGDAIMQSQQDRQDAADTESSAVGPLAAPESDDPFLDNTSSTLSSLPGVNLNSSVPRMLGSPFRASETLTSKPRRFRVRHLAHNSLDSFPSAVYGSIGERLEDAHPN